MGIASFLTPEPTGHVPHSTPGFTNTPICLLFSYYLNSCKSHLAYNRAARVRFLRCTMAPIDVDDDDFHVGSNDVTGEPQQKKREDKVYARRLIYASSKRKVVWSSEDIDNDKHQQQRQQSKRETMVEADVSPDDFDYDSDYFDYDNDYSDYDSDYSDSDSDYSDYGGRFRSMTQAERERYNEQIRESGGFDVDVPPDVAGIGLIRPSNFDKYPQFFEELENCSRYAIDHYNFNNTTNYLFMRPVKVCSQRVAGRNHYITFEAKATAAAAPMYFQALVYHRVLEDYIEVTFCRRKPEC